MLAAQRGVSASRVVLWGHSLGGGVAAALAREWARAGGDAEDAGDLGALVLESSFDALAAAVADHPSARPFRALPGALAYLQAGLRGGRGAFGFETAAHLAALEGLPVLLLHGGRDGDVPVAHALRNYAAAAALDPLATGSGGEAAGGPAAAKSAGEGRVQLRVFPAADHVDVVLQVRGCFFPPSAF